MTRPDYLILVNRTHPVPEDWANHIQLEEIETKHGPALMESETLVSFRRLQDALRSDRVILGVTRAYCSVSRQRELLEEMTKDEGAKWAERHVAPPGCSEHHTGLAVDVWLDFIAEDLPHADEFPDGYLHSVLCRHLSSCGFILRYPEGKSAITGYDPESWHIRYTGMPHSIIMEKEHLVLEEYLQVYKH